MKATKRTLTDLLPNALPLAAGLLGLLLAPAVDRWVERFDAWVDTRLNGAFNASGRHLHHP